ncbi:hypothetical protein ACWD4N_48410, partial [Streptomyces sp. NPDC002586]
SVEQLQRAYDAMRDLALNPAEASGGDQQQIIDELHHHAGHITATWEGDGLRLAWRPAGTWSGAFEVVEPDACGRYAIGGLWPWTAWDDRNEVTARRAAFARGVRESFTAACGPLPHGLTQHYDRGRSQAHRLTVLPLVCAAPAGCGEW